MSETPAEATVTHHGLLYLIIDGGHIRSRGPAEEEEARSGKQHRLRKTSKVKVVLVHHPWSVHPGNPGQNVRKRTVMAAPIRGSRLDVGHSRQRTQIK